MFVYEFNQEDFRKVVGKLAEFMLYTQKTKPKDSYLIVNRNSPILAKAALKAAEDSKLNVFTFDLDSKTPYEHFPKELVRLLIHNTPKAGMGLFDYSENPDWNLREVGARIELLHNIIEEVPISWAHSPGITLDMALNGPLQCDYRKMNEESEKILQVLKNIKKIHITSPGGTNIEVEIPPQVKFDTDCTITTPNIYGKPGKFGNLPVGEVWSQRDEILNVLNKETGLIEKQSYPVKHVANGVLVCDVAAGGFAGGIDRNKPLIAKFKDGVLVDLHSDDTGLNGIREDITCSEAKYGMATVLEEVGIGLNDKARVTGNMLEDEKIRGTCHLAPGNIRCHVDMLVDKPSITGQYQDGKTKEIMINGVLL
jgi:aminopeptidase